MPKFLNNELADLTHQLTLSPRRLRMGQICGVNTLLGIIEADHAYPFEFVCYHITKYHKRAKPDGFLIAGKALVRDLATMVEVLSRKANLSVADLGEGYKTQQELADQLQVSTKTIRRWRDRGLAGLRVTFEDGVNRLAFLGRTIDRFVERNKTLVDKGASFKQLTAAERDCIVERARELLVRRPLKLHALARLIAEEMGRAVETIRYTLRRYDEANPSTPLLTQGNESVHCERELAMWSCKEAGDTVASIACAFECTEEEIDQIIRRIQILKWRELPLDHLHNELFDAPVADAIILDVPQPSPSDAPLARPPKDLPAYLRSLYRTPLLTVEQEQDLFRRYNYVKFKTSRMLACVDIDAVTDKELETLGKRIAQVDELRQRIVRANLRLVVSIAKRHVGWCPNFYEVISDGNISLMRAVEKFDFSRGTKFSTYASWAIMKNYARSIPEEHYRTKRYVTGQDQVLDATADRRDEPGTCESDRRKIREVISDGMKELPERDREVLKGHFGLGGQGETQTLEQLGRRFGVTKERIRQIEQRALLRLREVLSPSLADAI